MPKAIVQTGDLTLGKTRIAGPCYDPPRHAALLTGLVDEQTGKPADKMPDLGLDLDGDGKKDAVLEIMRGTAIEYALYVKRGTCGYFVGRIEARGTLVARKVKENELVVLGVNVICKKPGCPSQNDFAFDGTAYVEKP